MAKIHSNLTILTCCKQNARATKKLTMLDNGTIHKESFGAGTYFTHRAVPVEDLESLGTALKELESQPESFVIRGQIKEGMPETVRRKMHMPEAAFDAVARPYLMLDIDKFPCPEFMNPAVHPEEAIKWVLEALPEPFKYTSCYYKFSSSQNINKDAGNTISVHLWFWCDREVKEDEWKRYFGSVSSPVDHAVFSAVQPHFTANPILENMQDPIPNRSGFLNGMHSAVKVPEIPKPAALGSKPRKKEAPLVHQENCEKAVRLLAPYYVEGVRDRMSGAIAATLYRGGWYPENTADFIYDLALSTSDEEAEARYKGAFRICDAIDNNRPAQGIPTLRDEIGIREIDEILELLSLGKPNVSEAIRYLNNNSGYDEIRKAMEPLVHLSEAERGIYFNKIKGATKLHLPDIKSIFKEIQQNQSSTGTEDWGDITVRSFLDNKYENGKHFLRSSDKNYWRYNGLYWEKAADDFVKKEIMECARVLISEYELYRDLSCLVNSALNLLQGAAFTQENPLRQTNYTPPSVINCLNGEVWFDKCGNTTFRPHRADSYLRYCLNVQYDPKAKSPKFDAALLNIFSKSSAPHEMVRHFLEVAGYICQPWRKLASIILLYGRGSNGKSSLLSIITRILGPDMFVAGRINDVSKDKFKLGSLDGKLMMYEDDVSMNTRVDDGFLKTISEEKPLNGEQKYKDSYQFICRALPVMLANDFPLISDLTDGFNRRAMAIPFDRKFTAAERKLELFDEIWEEEASGILNQIIAGFTRLKKRQAFDEPQDCILTRNKWLSGSNILPVFISEVCEIGEGYTQHLAEMYASFSSYCERTGAKPVPRQQWLSNRLEQMGFEISKSGGHLTVRGVRVQLLESDKKEDKVNIK
ncbi:MAG: phage/plasmid primase, P4 family, partial [Alphaproteobacteria bacterium]|nr:phage/plasmid primase, P4 family [Alphaproteobacteria bacterium]